jgi:hypothetical protein
MAEGPVPWGEYSKQSEARLRQDIAEVPAKVAAMSPEELTREHDHLSHASMSDEYTVAYANAVHDRYFDELGKLIEEHPITSPRSHR